MSVSEAYIECTTLCLYVEEESTYVLAAKWPVPVYPQTYRDILPFSIKNTEAVEIYLR